MKRNTHLANSVEATVYRSKYDAEVKWILANKQILAWIMKYTTKEFKGCTIEQIMDCIEDEPEVAEKCIYPGQSKITGLSTESQIPNEGKVTYDIRLCAVTPDNQNVRIFLNVEAQKKYHVGCDIVPRGIFYCARMLSEQLDTEFTVNDYNGIKKVYSIWICMETPEKTANTITDYSIYPNNLYGEFESSETYDLLSVIMVRLSGKENAEDGNELLQMLTTLLSHKLDAETKKKVLEERYHMKMTETVEGGLESMCNLSELVWEHGMENGLAQGQKIARCSVIRNLRDKMSVDEIINVLNCDSTFVESIMDLLQSHPEASDEEIVTMVKE